MHNFQLTYNSGNTKLSDGAEKTYRETLPGSVLCPWASVCSVIPESPSDWASLTWLIDLKILSKKYISVLFPCYKWVHWCHCFFFFFVLAISAAAPRPSEITSGTIWSGPAIYEEMSAIFLPSLNYACFFHLEMTAGHCIISTQGHTFFLLFSKTAHFPCCTSKLFQLALWRCLSFAFRYLVYHLL